MGSTSCCCSTNDRKMYPEPRCEELYISKYCSKEKKQDKCGNAEKIESFRKDMKKSKYFEALNKYKQLKAQVKHKKHKRVDTNTFKTKSSKVLEFGIMHKSSLVVSKEKQIKNRNVIQNDSIYDSDEKSFKFDKNDSEIDIIKPRELQDENYFTSKFGARDSNEIPFCVDVSQIPDDKVSFQCSQLLNENSINEFIANDTSRSHHKRNSTLK